MANLYLTEQGAVLRKTGERLLVEKDDQELLEIECFKVDTIFVFGNVHVTSKGNSRHPKPKTCCCVWPSIRNFRTYLSL
jgi:hypothetical protein